MEQMTCYSCNTTLKSEMDIEYSNWLSEYFCSPGCAIDSYFNHMESRPLDLENTEELEEYGIKLVDGELFRV